MMTEFIAFTCHSAIHFLNALAPSHPHTLIWIPAGVVESSWWDILLKLPHPHRYHIVFLGAVWLMQLQDGRNSEVPSGMLSASKDDRQRDSPLETGESHKNGPHSFTLTGFTVRITTNTS